MLLAVNYLYMKTINQLSNHHLNPITLMFSPSSLDRPVNSSLRFAMKLDYVLTTAPIACVRPGATIPACKVSNRSKRLQLHSLF